MRRRSLVASLAAGGLATITGCSALADEGDPSGGSPTDDERSPDEYDLLATQRVYVASDVSLALPADVPRVESAEEATVVVLPGTTDVAAETGIEWLASGTAVAFVGTEGQATLVDWIESEAYAETFESRGFGVGSPPPDFLVAFGVDRQYVSTHSYTWGGTSNPDDERYLGALEDALEDAGGE